MESIYGSLPDEIIVSNIDDLINQVFKLLPLREANDARLDEYITNTIFRVSGTARLFDTFPEWITILSILESAREETSFYRYRKAILDSCSILRSIQKKVGETDAE